MSTENDRLLELNARWWRLGDEIRKMSEEEHDKVCRSKKTIRAYLESHGWTYEEYRAECQRTWYI